MQPMKVLVGCETSGTVRDAFLAEGHDAWSVDLLPSDTPSNRHIIGDIRDHLDGDWDLLAVLHPPCTRLCNSGVRWLNVPPPGRTLDEMWDELREGASLFSDCLNAHKIPMRCIENPVMHGHAKQLIQNYRTPQIVQPWWFGDPAFKATGLYLVGLDELEPTNKLTPPAKGTPEYKRWSAVHLAPPGPERWKIRSKFFPGIAKAMATQWGTQAYTKWRMAA